MSSATFVNQDFGSESEDDNFNPAPAEDSDNDAPGSSDVEGDMSRKMHDAQKGRRTSAQQMSDDDEEGVTQRPSANGADGRRSHGHSSRELKDEEDVEHDGNQQNDSGGLNGAADDDEGDEEDEDEDEEEEGEAISVRSGASMVACSFLTSK